MKANKRFLYIAHFLLDWGIFPTKVEEKIKTRILLSVTIYIYIYKSCRS